MSTRRSQADKNIDSKKSDVIISVDELLKDPVLVESDVDFKWLTTILDNILTDKSIEPPVDLLNYMHEKVTDNEKR